MMNNLCNNNADDDKQLFERIDDDQPGAQH